jgi:DNA-3-methyladenine glycosylase
LSPRLPAAADDAVVDLDAPILPANFYLQPTLRVARALLGKILVHRGHGAVTAGRIVEVEAYRGPEDRAAHTAGGRRTARNEVMWGPGGRLYVYFTYGMHHCCNVVTRTAGRPEAVLLRALEPVAGVALMQRRRGIAGAAAVDAVARGPGNLCRAMGIDLRHDGADLRHGPILILDAPPVPSSAVAVSPRIGVAYAGTHALRPWRLFVRTSRAVSGRRIRTAPSPRGRLSRA